MDMFIASAWAQTTAPAAAAPNQMMQLIPLIMIFLVFYFLMIRPQKKRMQEEQNFLKGLAKGDEVYTKSGMLGTVAGLADQFVTLEIAEGVKVKVVKNQIAGSSKVLTAAPKEVAAKKK